MKKKSRKPSSQLWGTEKADKVFSWLVRTRDGKCLRCGKREYLQCSHYWSRIHSSTRYDFENCVTLCAGCHLFKWEMEKQGEYQDFMVKKLGLINYGKLKKKACMIKSRKEAIEEFQSAVMSDDSLRRRINAFLGLKTDT